MEFQKKVIHQQIIDAGWNIIEVGKVELEWWANEMWRLESTWSPVGKFAYVTFLNDPQITEPVVWGALASKEKPLSWQAGEESHFIFIKNRWQETLPQMIDYLSKIRNS